MNDVESGSRQASKPSFGERLVTFLPVIAGIVLIVIGFAVGFSPSSTDSGPKDHLERARWLMKNHLTIDGHNDIPYQFRKQVQNHVQPSPIDLRVEQPDRNLHTDIPKLREGQLTGQFWSVYVDCGKNDKDAVRSTLEQIDVMERIIDLHPDVFERAFTADAIEDAFRRGKIASLYGVEGGHQIDSSMATLRMYYELGVRYMTLTHNCDIPWARWWGSEDTGVGLTDWGKDVIREMNRMGMFVDLSHVNKQVMLDVLTMDPPVPPVMFSHSSAYAVCPVLRNVQDDVLQLVQKNGGIVMINFASGFINPNFPEEPATLEQVVDHIEHIKNVASIDIVGLGADYDGVTDLPEGLETVADYPALIARMLERGFTDEECIKVMGGNLLRAMRGVEAYKFEHMNDPVGQNWIEPEAVEDNECRTKN